MLVKNSEECLCGSGKKFKSCCKGKVYNSKSPYSKEMLNNPNWLNHILLKKMENTDFKICLYPEKERCKLPIKNAHALQNNGVLSLIAENNHVMVTDLLNKIRENSIMHKVSKNDATTFYGFCEYHDSVVFYDIEQLEYTRTIKQNFLFAYRACAQEYHKKQREIKGLQNCVKENPSILQCDAFVSSYKNQKMALADTTKIMDICNKAFRDNCFDIFNTYIYEFPTQYDFAVTTMFAPAVDLNGNEINDIYSTKDERLKPVFMTFIPAINKSYFIFSYLKSDNEYLEKYFEQVKNLDEDKLKNFINNTIPEYSENLVLSPRLWNKWTNFSKKQYEKVVAGQIGEFDKVLRCENPFENAEDWLQGLKIMNGLMNVLEKTPYDLFKH